MSPADQYEAVLSAAHAYFKPRGYSRSGPKFRRSADGNFVIVQFQKSAWSSADSLQFTVNFAIVSSSLAAKDGQDAEKLRSERQGHAQARIGQFRERPNDIWWTLDNASRVEAVLAEMAPLLERGTLFFEANASDASLAALWTESLRAEPGLSPIPLLRIAVGTLKSG